MKVPVKWMDRLSATEMERGSASEINRRTKGHKNENATEIDSNLIIFCRTGTRMCY